jgi:hypothetical protein
MNTLDKLIIEEERRIDFLLQVQSSPEKIQEGATRRAYPGIENDIERAYEQLAIYKIRRMMGFTLVNHLSRSHAGG